MMDGPFPNSYEQWHHCITVECGIKLTPDYVAERLTVWRQENLEETKRFRHFYGDAYLRQVVSWFERAESSLT